MNCKDFQDIVDSYLSDELLTETNHEIMRHMESCPGCQDVIAARREVRKRLKSAVLASPEYRIDEGFDHKLMTQLRHESEKEESSSIFSFFGVRSLAAAAVLVVAGVIGLGVYSSFDGQDSAQYLVSGFAEDSLVNIASGDHQNCAVSYNLNEPPVPLARAGTEYEGLADVIEAGARDHLSDLKLVESHACKFKNVRFAHYVLSGPNDTISILVTPVNAGSKQGVSEFSSNAYHVSNFATEKNAVFVISAKGKKWNRLATEALERPIEDHFAKQNGVQTAMLTALVTSSSFAGQ